MPRRGAAQRTCAVGADRELHARFAVGVFDGDACPRRSRPQSAGAAIRGSRKRRGARFERRQ